MNYFLCVMKETVVDQVFVAAVPAIPEIVEDLTAVPSIAGVPGIPAVPEVPLVTHEEVTQVYIETAAAQVAKVLAAQTADPNAHKGMTYYHLKFNAALRPTVKTVREKGRVSAPVKEIVTIESQDGDELGSGEV